MNQRKHAVNAILLDVNICASLQWYFFTLIIGTRFDSSTRLEDSLLRLVLLILVLLFYMEYVKMRK